MERVSSNSNLNSRRRREERLKELEARKYGLRRHSIAEVEHTLSEKYESLDYEVVENELYRAAEKDKDHQVGCNQINLNFTNLNIQKNLFRQSLSRWFVCFLIGVFTAFVAAFINQAVHYNAYLKFNVILDPSKIITQKSIQIFSVQCMRTWKHWPVGLQLEHSLCLDTLQLRSGWHCCFIGAVCITRGYWLWHSTNKMLFEWRANSWICTT